MDGKKAQIFLKCLEQGSMMKAAEALGYTPSGLTHMMDAIEQDVGVKVIQRGRFGIKLTKAGERLLPHFQGLAEADSRLYAEAALCADKAVELLRVGAYASIARNWLPEIIGAFQSENPGVEVEMTVDGREELFGQLLRGRQDLVFLSPMDKYPHEFIFLRDDRFYAVLPPDSDFPGEVFPVKEFEKYPFIMPSLGRDTDVCEVLNANGTSPKILASTADDPVVLSMVAGGLGVSMLSELVLMSDSSDVLALPVEPAAYRKLGIAVKSRDKMRGVERRFVELTREILGVES